MRWDDFQRSDNIEDRRGEDGSGGGGMPVGAGGLSIGTVVVLGLLGWALGIDPRLLIGGAEVLSHRPAEERDIGRTPSQRKAGAPEDDMGKFVAAVLGEIDNRWKEVFAKEGQTYRGPRIVLYSGSTNAPCGGRAQSAMGPFYCPPDKTIYLDTSFFRLIETRFRGCQGKACQFTQAYVIAHEIGHHVQNRLGIIPKVQEMQRSLDKVEANRLQVRVELQADCFAGLWAAQERRYRQENQKPDFLDPGDVDAALQTAAAIGDDTLQRQSQGRVVPDAFTHGSAEQRKRWFMRGFNEGKVSACNTFNTASL